MPGEPAWFDVSKLESIEIETGTGAEIESKIIDWGESFFLRATFGAAPHVIDWVNMTNGGFEYTVQFYGEGMGFGVADHNFGTTKGSLVAGQAEYVVKSPTTSISDEGIWRCGVTVTFRNQDQNVTWFGVLGYNEDCVIQISAAEEPG